MPSTMIVYTFAPSVSMEEAEASLLLALLGTESLHGETVTRLEAPHSVSREQHQVSIDDSSQPGRDLNRLFLGFVSKEFGPDSFMVRRVAEVISIAKPPRGLPPLEWN